MTAVLNTTKPWLDRLTADEGCVGYLVTDPATKVAIAIDPRLDHVSRFQELIATRGAKLAFVADTHTHADHLSGARRLADLTGAKVLLQAKSQAKGEARRVSGGDKLELGSAAISILETPGHTPDSMSLLIEGMLFTGDALFVGGAGRTDFMGGSSSELFDSFRRLEALPDDTVVYPGHDYTNRPHSTIGAEKAENPLFREKDKDALVKALDKKGEPPKNMAGILRYNLAEKATSTISPKELAPVVGKHILIDVRTPLEFGSEWIEGSKLIPMDVLESRAGEVPEGAIIVCRSGMRATMASETLARAGKKVTVLEGGVLAWRKAKLPLKEGRKAIAIDRQVQIVAGSVTLVGTLLGAFVHPGFLVLPGFFGAGLVFAGVSGTCGLGVLLAKAPWNPKPAPAPAASPSTCAASTCAAPAPAPPKPTCAA